MTRKVISEAQEESLRFDNPFLVNHNDAAEAADLQTRAEMIIALRDYFRFKGMNQAKIGSVLGIPQPRVSELMTAKISTLSSATLNNYLGRLKLRFSVSFVKEPKAGKAHIEARVVEFA